MFSILKMKIIIIALFLIITVTLSILIYNKLINDKESTTIKSGLLSSTTNTEKLMVPSNFDFKSKMSYYVPLGVSIRDNNLVTIVENNKKLFCIDEFNTSNNLDNSVKIKDCENNDSQSLQVRQFSTIPKIYNSNIDKCLTFISNVVDGDRLIFSDCKAASNDIQNFRIDASNNIAYKTGSTFTYLSYDNNNNAILINDKNAAPKFQSLSFNQECTSDFCRNLINLKNGYYLIVDTNGILRLLKQTIDKNSFSINYDEIWYSENLPISGKYTINFDDDSNLKVVNSLNNNTVWSTSSFNKAPDSNKIKPYKLELIDNELTVVNGLNQIMYIINPKNPRINCKLDSITESICYNNNIQYRLDILTPSNETGISCEIIAKTLDGNKWDISSTAVQTLIPSSGNYNKQFMYRNEICNAPNPSFSAFGNCTSADSYYYYYLKKERALINQEFDKKRIVVLCYDDKDKLIGVKTQPDVNLSFDYTFQNMQQFFLSPTISSSNSLLTLSKNTNTLSFNTGANSNGSFIGITLIFNNITYPTVYYTLEPFSIQM
jgi:hypothetical protein